MMMPYEVLNKKHWTCKVGTIIELQYLVLVPCTFSLLHVLCLHDIIRHIIYNY